jgi:outer membrane protein assembly factor BamE (lipoprotein component of BamABCDE complex)
MKKIALLLVITFIVALAVSSCNTKTCPAYSKADTEQNNQVG